MSDAVLTLLKFGLLAALYLFFAWVLWTAIAQIRVPAPTAAPATRPATPQAGRTRTAVRGPVSYTHLTLPTTSRV